MSQPQVNEEIQASQQLLTQLQSVATNHPTGTRANSGANLLKRHHDEDITVASNAVRDLQGPNYTDTESNVHDGKRTRGADWPTQSVERTMSHYSSSRRSHPRRHKYLGLSPSRSSRFTEGSMGDRTSNKPPSVYIRNEGTYYQAGHGKVRRSGESDATFSAGIESSKPSGMYKFGKAIANAFNPVSVWHGINGMWKERDVQLPAEKAILEERKAKAETAYEELKAKGYKGTKGVLGAHINVPTPTIKYEGASEPMREPFRDSGVDVDDYGTISEQHDGYVSFNEQAFVSPPQIPEKGHSMSPFSDANTSIKSSLHLRKPSLQGLKKAASHVHLPLGKRSSFQATASSQVNLPATFDSAGSGLRSEPSRKDLARQFKLSKRVSDLESKLNVARRELTLLENDKSPVPEVSSKLGIRPFKPGTLATLPSERLLHQSKSGVNSKKEHDNDRSQKTGESTTGLFSNDGEPLNAGTLAFLNRDPIIIDEREKEDKSKLEIGRTHEPVSQPTMPSKLASEIEGTLRQKQPTPKPPPPVVSYYEPPMKGLDHKVAKSEPKKATSKKRKSGRRPSDGGTYRPGSDDDDDVEWVGTKTTPSRNQTRPHKAVKTFLDDSPSRSKLVAKPTNLQNTPISVRKDTYTVRRSLDRGKGFEAAAIDKKKIMAMRSNQQSKAAFGTLSDDIINVRKMYPSITQQQLVDSMKSPAQSTKVTDHTSVLHPNQHTTTFLGPPHSASTTKTKINVTKHAISPDSQGEQVKAGAMEIVPEDVVITISPSEHDNVPPIPSLGKSFNERAVASEKGEDKVMKEVPKEDFQWDDDIF